MMPPSCPVPLDNDVPRVMCSAGMTCASNAVWPGRWNPDGDAGHEDHGEDAGNSEARRIERQQRQRQDRAAITSWLTT